MDRSWKWNFNFAVDCDSSKAVEQSIELAKILKGILLTADSVDVFRWRNNVDGEFFVKSCYLKLNLVAGEDEEEIIKAVRQVWISKVPSKIKKIRIESFVG